MKHPFHPFRGISRPAMCGSRRICENHVFLQWMEKLLILPRKKKSKSVIVWYQCRNYAIPSEDDCCRVSGSTGDWKIPGWCADLFGMKQFDLKWTVYPIMLTKCWNQSSVVCYIYPGHDWTWLNHFSVHLFHYEPFMHICPTINGWIIL